MLSKKMQLWLIIGFYSVLILLPIALKGNLYVMNVLIISFIWLVVASSWELIMGHAGIFTFGQVAFFVIGAYSSAIITRATGMSPWLGMPLAGVIVAGIGVLVALPCIKLKGAYVALVTFAVHMLLEPLFKSGIGRSIGTGGAQGILSVPPLKIGDYIYTSLNLVPAYYTIMAISFASLMVIYVVIHSSWGLAFLAIRDSKQFAKNLGVNEFKYKLAVFAVSSGLTGLAGGFYAHYVGMVSTRILGLDLFLLLMVMLVFGGIGCFPGVMIGTFLTMFLSESLRPLAAYRLMIFGAMVMVLVMFLPKGIIGLINPLMPSMINRKKGDV